MKPHVITDYEVRSPKLQKPLCLAVVTDLHGGEYADVIPALRKADAILVVGDLVNRHAGHWGYALDFLRDAPAIAPTFFSIGNHELLAREAAGFRKLLNESQMTVLDNRWTTFEGIVLGGLSSVCAHGKMPPDVSFLSDMAAQPGFRLLMCHQPEFYARYVAPYALDLTVSGHAHGGQVALWGQGLYAPGQGILPKWTSGFYFDKHLLVSRGMTNSARAPRIGVPRELLMLHLLPCKG